jgi:hypothetical protein
MDQSLTYYGGVACDSRVLRRTSELRTHLPREQQRHRVAETETFRAANGAVDPITGTTAEADPLGPTQTRREALALTGTDHRSLSQS